MHSTCSTTVVAEIVTTAFEAGPVEQAPERIASAPGAATLVGRITLPEKLTRPDPRGYARHLVHLDPLVRFSVLAMVWGPGQGTPLHDHDGRWGVECVLEGAIESEAFDLVGATRHGLVQFRSRGIRRETAGATGIVAPDDGYHLIRNPSATATAITIHVYQGELQRCTVFHSVGGELYLSEHRALQSQS